MMKYEYRWVKDWEEDLNEWGLDGWRVTSHKWHDTIDQIDKILMELEVEAPPAPASGALFPEVDLYAAAKRVNEYLDTMGVTTADNWTPQENDAARALQDAITAFERMHPGVLS